MAQIFDQPGLLCRYGLRSRLCTGLKKDIDLAIVCGHSDIQLTQMFRDQRERQLVVACRMADNVPRERVDPFAICCDHKLPKLRDRCVRARSRGCDRRLCRTDARLRFKAEKWVIDQAQIVRRQGAGQLRLILFG